MRPQQNGLCSTYSCQNGGSCLEIRNVPICNCTTQWNGKNCEKFVGHNNPCINYCQNSGICHLYSEQPACTCIGEWIGRKCENPPNCIEECGVCLPDSSINECAYVFFIFLFLEFFQKFVFTDVPMELFVLAFMIWVQKECLKKN